MSDEKGEGQDDVGEEGCGGGARSRSRLADVNGGSTGGSDGRDRAVSGRRVSGRGRGLVARLLVLGLVVTVVASCARPVRRRPQPRPYGLPTIADRVAQYGSVARARLAPYFRAARVPYPPTRFVLLGLKQERELQLFAAGPGQQLTFIRTYPIYGASGVLGPKLREGDRQVPEGIYTIAYMNPNSISHLSLALSYPNEWDRAHAAEDGRPDDTLGGSIMIHGGSGSIGCMAVGDGAAEDLFVLTADAGWNRGRIVVSPVDFRRTDLPADYRPSTPWVNDLYAWIRAELRTLPLAPQPAQSVAAGAP